MTARSSRCRRPRPAASASGCSWRTARREPGSGSHGPVPWTTRSSSPRSTKPGTTRHSPRPTPTWPSPRPMVCRPPSSTSGTRASPTRPPTRRSRSRWSSSGGSGRPTPVSVRCPRPTTGTSAWRWHSRQPPGSGRSPSGPPPSCRCPLLRARGPTATPGPGSAWPGASRVSIWTGPASTRSSGRPGCSARPRCHRIG